MARTPVWRLLTWTTACTGWAGVTSAAVSVVWAVEDDVASPEVPSSSERMLLPAPAEIASPAKKRAEKDRVVAKRRPLFGFGAG
jgi:hypothetical protein